MASLGTVFVDVKMDDNQVRSESRRVGTKASEELGKAGGDGGRKAGDEFAKGFGNSSGRIRGVGADLGKSLLAGFAGIGVGVAVGKVFSTGFGELTSYEKGLSQLQAGLKSTGGVAGITADQMENLASQIQGYSGQTDDSIVATEQLLLTFTNIRNVAGKNNDIFTQTTKIAADMAARLGGDASGAAIQLGKALNDPIKGLTALTRVGVSFTQEQKDQIAAMVKAGDTMGAQKIILAELNKEFGGSAAAYGKTLPGEIDRAKRAFEDFAQNGAQKTLTVLGELIHISGDVVGFFQHNQGAAVALSGVLGASLVPKLAELTISAQAFVATKLETAFLAGAGGIQAMGAALLANPELYLLAAGLAAAGAAVAIFAHQERAARIDVQSLTDAVKQQDSVGGTSLYDNLIKQFSDTDIANKGENVLEYLQRYKVNVAELVKQVQSGNLYGGGGVFDQLRAIYNDPSVSGGTQVKLNKFFIGLSNDIGATRKAEDAFAKQHDALVASLNKTPGGRFILFMQNMADAEKTLSAATGENNKTLSGQVDLLAGYAAQADITSAKLRDNLQQSLQTLAGEGANIQKLEASGLDPKFIKALVDKGPEYVAAAASASLAEQKKLNDTYLQGESQRWHTAAEIARAESPKAAQAIAAGQAFTQAAIEKTTQDVQTLNFWLHALQDVKRVTFLSTGVPDVVGDITRINTALGAIGNDYVVSVGGTGRKLIPGGSGADGMLIKGPGGPREDNILIRASAGEAVVPAHLVPKYAPYFASDGIPGFANGGLLDTTVKVDTMGIGNSLFSGYGGIFSGGVGAGVQQWAGPALQALAMLGLSASLLPKVLRQIQTESGGNAGAINLTDSNAAAGHPSMGLMQTIMSTFLAYAGPYAALGPFNGFADLYAGLNYAKSRYGPDLAGLGEGHGYDNGGWLKPGWNAPIWNGTGRPENVQSPEERDALIREIKTLQKITGMLADRFADRLDGVAKRGRVDARTRTY